MTRMTHRDEYLSLHREFVAARLADGVDSPRAHELADQLADLWNELSREDQSHIDGLPLPSGLSDRVLDERIRLIGSRTELAFRLRWCVPPRFRKGEPEDHLGRIEGWIAGRPVWGRDTDGETVSNRVDLEPLLGQLAQLWNAVLHEDRTALRAAQRMRDHTLAPWRDDQLHCPLVIWREGRTATVESPDAGAVLRHAAVMRVVEGLGDALAAGLQGTDAARQWLARSASVNEATILRLETGFDDQLIREVFADIPAARRTEQVRAAARMSAWSLGAAGIRQILGLIAEVPRCTTTTELTGLVETAATLLDPHNQPWEQGYALAHWLRTQLGHTPYEPVDPLDVLKRWEVGVFHKELPGGLDGLGVWGPDHGPAVLLARDQRGFNRERATAAHEICHLLVDRDGALPVVEVLNGSAPPRVEKRARAFQAELLLPREAAQAAHQQHGSPADALAWLTLHFSVSEQLAANQVLNSRAFMTADDRRFYLAAAERSGN